MLKLIPVATAVALLTTGPSFAQSYCDQVRAAVAMFGYDAARQHALSHYGRDAVRFGDTCLAGTERRSAPGRDYEGYGFAPRREYQGYWTPGR